MPRTEPTVHRGAIVVVVVAALALLVATGLLLREYGPGNMGTGFLQGATVGLLAMAVVGWRAARRRASTFERAWTQTGDERDDALLTRSLAVLGLLSMPLTGIGTVAIGLGATVPMVLALLMLAQATVLAVTFAVLARRG